MPSSHDAPFSPFTAGQGRAGNCNLVKLLLAFGYAVSAHPQNLRTDWALLVFLTLDLRGPKGKKGC